MVVHGDKIVALLDAMKNSGSTWQDFFVEIKRRFGCEMYACCSEQLSEDERFDGCGIQGETRRSQGNERGGF